MRPTTLVFSLCVLLLADAATWAQTAVQADMTALRALKEDAWPRAYREGDVALLDRILAKEFQMVDAEGGWSDKQKELAYIAKHKASYKAFRFEITRLEVFENGTAVVAGRGVVTGPASDPTGAFEYQSTNILIKRDGRWQAIASHVSGVRTIAANGRP